MSKQKITKFIHSLTQDQLKDFVIEMYQHSAAVKSYVDHFLNPEVGQDMLDKYKKIIEKEFYPKNPERAGMKYSVAKKAIKEFAALQPDPIYLGELMLYLPELASRLSHDYGDITEQYYISAETNFNLALKYIAKQNLLEHFKPKAQLCIKYASRCGYGFDKSMEDIYYDFYED